MTTEELEKIVSRHEMHILSLFARFGSETVFGRSDVCLITQLRDRAASELLMRMLSEGLLIPVSGQGKGKYRFGKGNPQ